MPNVLTDQEFQVLTDSFDFFVNPNWFEDAKTPARRRAIDELLRIIPFEAYDRNPINGVKPSRPDASEPTPAWLPGLTAAEGTWFASGAAPAPDFDVDLELAVDTTYETFMFRRVGIFWGLDPYQRKMAATRGPQSQGPDPVATFLRIAKIAVLRALGRGIVNGLGSSPEIRGLAGLYNGQFGSNDTQQVLKSTSFSLAEVRQLCRRATPSGEDGLGEGPNALLMSMRTRDKLVSVERAANNTPTFLPDPLTGRLRYHFDGIPVYVGPAREDEEDNTLPSFGDTSSTHRSSIYALRIGGRTGIRVLHFGGDSNNHGLNIEEIAPSDTGPIGYRAHGSYTLFVPERQSVARLWHIDISSEAI